jgi:hypothetical protein
MLEDRLASTFHINQDSLPEMPTQKLVNGSLRIIKKLLMEMLAGEVFPTEREEYNLIIILR